MRPAKPFAFAALLLCLSLSATIQPATAATQTSVISLAIANLPTDSI